MTVGFALSNDSECHDTITNGILMIPPIPGPEFSWMMLLHHMPLIPPPCFCFSAGNLTMSDKSFHPYLAVSNIKNHIPITLDMENVQYSTWSVLFKIHARSHRVLAHIIDPKEGTSKPPSTDQEKELWTTPDSMAWDRLRDIFQDNQHSRALSLEQEFSTTSMENSPNASSYCQHLKSLADELKNVRALVSDSRMVLHLTGGLTRAYRGAGTLIHQSNMLPPFYKARSTHVLKEIGIEKEAATESSMVAASSDDSSDEEQIFQFIEQQAQLAGRGSGAGQALNMSLHFRYQVYPWGYGWPIPPSPYPTQAWTKPSTPNQQDRLLDAMHTMSHNSPDPSWNHILTQFERNVKNVQCDNGREFDDGPFWEFCKKHGMSFRVSCPHTSSQNGKAERKIRTINNISRTLLAHASLPPSFWHHSLQMTTYLLNILQSKLLGNKSPLEILYEREPSYSHLRSTSGYCVFLGDNLVSWSSKRQPTLSHSSAEAEYRAVANVVSESCWIRNLLLELNCPIKKATLVYRDNVRVLLVPSRYQIADIFTKVLPRILLEQFRDNPSVRKPPALLFLTPNFVALLVAIFVYIRISKIERWNRGKYSFTHICVVFDLTYLMFDPPTLSLYLSILAQSSAHVPLVSQFGEAMEMASLVFHRIYPA
uniref:Integrase catalytic domain-containing protein n=1 Tax=Solanum lycopersicum TaxID=4081 RepID=A0A3Q7J8R6_SOLLC